VVNAIRRIEPRRQKDRAASDRAGEPARASARGQARVSVEVLEERLSEAKISSPNNLSEGLLICSRRLQFFLRKGRLHSAIIKA
jgi:ribosomal protein S4